MAALPVVFDRINILGGLTIKTTNSKVNVYVVDVLYTSDRFFFTTG